MSHNIREKDPAAIRDFPMDYSEYLESLGSGLTITDSEWIVPDGITEVNADFTNTATRIQLSGGTHGTDYELLNHITLSDGQEDEFVLIVRVRDVESSVLSGDALDRERAISLVSDRAQPDVAPKLTPSEIELKIDESRIAATWTANTAYNIGDRVVPAVRNGHYYRCIQPGTSQAGARLYTDWPLRTESQLGDGTSDPGLIWEEAGSDVFNPGIAGAERNIYDVGRAARECWKLKASKASHLPDYDEMALSQLRKNCLDEANAFRPYRSPITLVRC